jgi:DNA-binding CsgD family transcriptional regulator
MMHGARMPVKSDKQSGRLDLISHIVRFRFDELKQSKSYLAVIVLLIAAAFFVQDIYIDILVEGKGLPHITVEGGVFIAVLLALGIEVKRVIDLHSTITVSQREVMRLKGHLSQVIANEFDHWNLTATEKEIALLLIKGLSMQEIAGIREVKEKSVRQQSTRIYNKAGVSNRNELTAHFIEDLLMPDMG